MSTALPYVLEAAYTLLLADSEFTALLGTDVGQTSVEGVVTPWVFQGLDADDRPYRDPKSSSTSAVVLTYRDSWGVNAHNTAGLPMLQVLVYADLTRQPSGEPERKDGIDRALRVFAPIDRLFHDVGARLAGQRVPVSPSESVTVVSSRRREGPTIQPVPNGDGLERLMARYEWVVA